MREVSRQQIGTALRCMAEDLVAERQRATRLDRENRELKAEVETLRRVVAERQRRARNPVLTHDEVGLRYTDSPIGVPRARAPVGGPMPSRAPVTGPGVTG
jgi:hypothetical protein